MSSNKTIVYFVDNVHSSFIINDIEELAKRFDCILLFSVMSVEKGTMFPKNVVVYQEYLDWSKLSIKHILKNNATAIFSIYLKECLQLKKLLPVKPSLALLASNIYKANTIEGLLKKGGHDISHALFYSFWFYDCIFLAWLTKKSTARVSYARAHGGDLFEERPTLKGKVLFRHFQLENIKLVYSISETGQEYLQKKYPAYAHKIKLSYLGTHEQVSRTAISDQPSGNQLRLFSCGNIVNGKRIYRIADTLLECTTQIEWTHYGKFYEDDKSDAFFKSTERLKSKPNINAIIGGSVPHEEIIEFYKTHKPDLFISLSEAEGIPVTMMEATSFGVPVLSTDVGGCREIVNSQTGILVDKEIGTTQLAEILDNFRSSEKNTPEFRKGVRTFWEQHFDIERNYDLFCESLGKN